MGKDPREGQEMHSVLRLVFGEGSDAPADAQAMADGQERISERMQRVTNTQASAEVREDHERQDEEAWLH